ncbi:MAG: dephospho-CoA kinase [Fibrobacter sp.]|nr:dephospho-CoA kinase [Fibrobacter sp.]
MTKTLKIGVAGLIGAGKSSLMQYLHKRGFPTVDADAEVHFLYANSQELRQSLAQNFGKEVLSSSGVNRAELGAIVFNDASKLQLLESLVHPLLFTHIQRKLADLAAETSQKAVFVEGALLNSWPHLLVELDQVWELQAPENIRLERVLARGSTLADAQAKIASQKDLPAIAHNCLKAVDNSRDLPHLEAQAQKLISAL